MADGEDNNVTQVCFTLQFAQYRLCFIACKLLNTCTAYFCFTVFY